MNTGAEVVVDRLVTRGVRVCFANPGTSEMHIVAATDDAPGMRMALCLFEGVATGAADGYARIAGVPAATLLHLGPGLANGLANLHNARRAHTPVVNIVGDHAMYHHKFDAPLESDIDAFSKWVHGSVHRPQTTAELGGAVDEAFAAAMKPPGAIATLVLPADLTWNPAPALDAPPKRGTTTSAAADIAAAAEVLEPNGPAAVLLLGGPATSVRGLRAAARIGAATGARVLIETFPARLSRGRGVPNFERLGYLAEQAEHQLTGTTHLILAAARHPVAFFAYPGKAGDLVPEHVHKHTLAAPQHDVTAALEALADHLGASEQDSCSPADHDPAPVTTSNAPLTQQNSAHALGPLLPPDAIISDESNTSGLLLPTATAHSPIHDLLTLTGGAIGQGLPVAIGAAIAAPHRPVVALQADGSACYTISALWTMAREHLDITVVILNNHAYSILALELLRMGAANIGEKARSLLDLSNPGIDFAAIATGFGMSASRATTTAELTDQFRAAVGQPGPHLIDAAVPALTR